MASPDVVVVNSWSVPRQRKCVVARTFRELITAPRVRTTYGKRPTHSARRHPTRDAEPTASRRFEDGGSVATFKRHVTCPYPAPTGDLFSPLGLQDSLPDNQSPHIRTDRQSGSPKLQVLQLAPPPKLSLSAPPRAQGIQHRTPADTYPGGVRTTGKSPPSPIASRLECRSVQPR